MAYIAIVAIVSGCFTFCWLRWLELQAETLHAHRKTDILLQEVTDKYVDIYQRYEKLQDKVNGMTIAQGFNNAKR